MSRWTEEHKTLLRECITHYISVGWKVVPLCFPNDDGVGCNCPAHRTKDPTTGEWMECKKPGKPPHSHFAPHGSKDMTDDMDKIDAWFEEDIPFNIGVVCGKQSALVVLDVDGPQGLASLGRFPTIPRTPSVLTGSGGKHYYFAHPMDIDVKNSASTVAPGLDVRGRFGYVVAPPSIHANGKPYTWAVDPRGVEPASMPDWVTSRQTRSGGLSTGGGQRLTQGQRNTTVFKIGAALRRWGCPTDEIYDCLNVINSSGRIDPPLDDDEIRLIAGSAGNQREHTEDTSAVGEDAANTDYIVQNEYPDTLASRFVDWCNRAFRYHMKDGWSELVDEKYIKVQEDEEILVKIRRYLQLIKVERQVEDDDGRFHVEYDRAKKMTSSHVKDIQNFLSSHAEVLIPTVEPAPQSLDHRLNPTYIIAAADCLVDFSEYPPTSRPHTRQFYTFNYLPYYYDESATSDIWDRFIVDITCGDQEIALLLQQWAGYLLMPTQQYHKFLLCTGTGSNGKSVYFDCLKYMLGEHNVSNVPLGKFGEKHALVDTWNKMANMSDESCRELEDSAGTTLKEFTGGGSVRYEPKYKPGFSAVPTAKLMFATNELPRITDTSDGTWRRMIYVPFNARFEGDRIDYHLKDRIRATELPAILNWALRGAKHLTDNGGFVCPDACAAGLLEYRKSMNPTGTFITDNLTFREGCRLHKNDLYEAYRRWCENNGHKAVSLSRLTKEITTLHPAVKEARVRTGLASERVRVFDGLALSDEADIHMEVY